MSSYSGSATNGSTTDVGLQLAPVGNDAPDHALLTKGFAECLSGLQSFFDQCEENRNTRFAEWVGRSLDGRKHKREGAKTDPTPWDGASDLQVFLVDEAIIAKTAMLCVAFQKANIVAVPIEGNDLPRAKIVGDLMRWIIHTQIPEMDRENELLANYFEEQGIGALGCFWEMKQEKILVTLTLDQLQQQFPSLNMQELIFAEEAKDDLLAILTEQYGCTRAKANKMLGELRAKQTTTVPTLGKLKSRPVVRAFNLNENLFIPNYATDLEYAPAIYRVEYYTAEQLRSFVNTSEWDEAWVDAAIDKCRGTLLNIGQNGFNQLNGRGNLSQDQRFTDLIGVVFAYQRLSDEDGNSGLYLTIFNPHLAPDETQDGYAKHGLLGYAHGQYPFVLFRREFLSRKLHDTRGISEPGKPLQQQIKVHKDSLVDAASIAICPPLMYPQGRPPTRWGAGAWIAERRPGEIHHGDRPAYDPSTQKSEEGLRADFNQYNGFVSRETDPTFASTKLQNEVNKFLGCWVKAMQQIFSLYQQFGSEEVAFRVIGSKKRDPELFRRGSAEESYDYYMTFDVLSTDLEQMKIKWKAIIEGVQLLNREGNVNFVEALQAYLESIDPNIADRILDPVDVGRQKVIEDEHADLAQIFAGINKDVKLGTPPQLGIQIIQNYAQAPDVQHRLQSDESFRDRIIARMKQYQMASMQEQNKLIGQKGALMPQQPMQ